MTVTWISMSPTVQVQQNSLYSNQFIESGNVHFIDNALDAGVGAIDQDSSGTCFGDIDNDGDLDLYVLGHGEGNKLFVNQGNGSFSDETDHAGLDGGARASSSCSFGDINGDGLIDLAVSNLFSGTNVHRLPIMQTGFEDLEEDNQLFINEGNNRFSDVSAESGINNDPGISWAIALVDYDIDGDLDLVVADDQGARAPGIVGGKDLGKLRLYSNTGSGKFVEVTDRMNGGRFGAWMSLSFGDLNSDGIMDIFASNIGDYMALFMQPLVGYPVNFNEWSTGWFLGQNDGGFTFVNNFEDLGPLPFGWGSAITDYDNDGDQDIIYHGGLDLGAFIDASNPGAILRNKGNGEFERDIEALANSTNHTSRNVNGVATADFNNDGFVDIVSVSNFNWPSQAPLVPYFTDPNILAGGAFDDAAFFAPSFTPVDPLDPFQGWTWNGIEEENGTLSVELNSGDNRNDSVRIKLIGTKDLSSYGKVNRDGIGAIVAFKPAAGDPVMQPVVSGGNYASQHSLDLTFGMGKADIGNVEVIWPGGVRNKLFGVQAGESINFPEIPCSYDDESLSESEYTECVLDHLNELYANKVITKKEKRRLKRSAKRAFGQRDLYKINDKISFVDISDRIDFAHLTKGTEGLTGAAWLDYDKDDDLDLFLTNGVGNNNALFRNIGDGEFEDVSEQAGIQNGKGNSGALAGDIDNDGYPDLFLSSDGGMATPTIPSEFKLYHNNGNGTFSDITDISGISGLITSFSSAFGDVNDDGYLDLLVSTPGSIPFRRQDRNKLFINNGDLTFTDVSEIAGVDTALGGCLASFTDYDLDGDQDILIGNCNEINILPVPIELFRNEGNLEFTNVTEESGLAERTGAWMGLSIADYDNDGDQDIYASNLGDLPPYPQQITGHVLFENNGDGTFTDVDQQAGVHEQVFSWGTSFSDFDNDGHTDLFVAGSFPFEPFSHSISNPGSLFINNRDKTFNKRNSWVGVDLSDRFTSGVAAADFNKDGFIDIVVAEGAGSVDSSLASERTPGHPILLENTGNKNKSITIRTVGTESNSAGIGARVVVTTGDMVQTKEVRAGSSFLSTESPWLTFGINDHSKIDMIEVFWPSGEVDVYKNIRPKRRKFITLVEGIDLFPKKDFINN